MVLFALFSEIEEAHIGKVYPPEPPFNAEQHVPVKIHSLKLEKYEPIRSLIALPEVHLLQRVELPPATRYSVHFICTLLEAARSHLRHVGVDMDNRDMVIFPQDARHNIRAILRPITAAIASLSVLESLSILVTIHGSPKGPTKHFDLPCFHGATYDFVVNTIRSLPPSVRIVTFLLHIERKDRKRNFPSRSVLAPMAKDWSNLDDALAV